MYLKLGVHVLLCFTFFLVKADQSESYADQIKLERLKKTCVSFLKLSNLPREKIIETCGRLSENCLTGNQNVKNFEENKQLDLSNIFELDVNSSTAQPIDISSLLKKEHVKPTTTTTSKPEMDINFSSTERPADAGSFLEEPLELDLPVSQKKDESSTETEERTTTSATTTTAQVEEDKFVSSSERITNADCDCNFSQGLCSCKNSQKNVKFDLRLIPMNHETLDATKKLNAKLLKPSAVENSLLTERKACSCDFSMLQCQCKTDRGHLLVVPLVGKLLVSPKVEAASNSAVQSTETTVYSNCDCDFLKGLIVCIDLQSKINVTRMVGPMSQKYSNIAKTLNSKLLSPSAVEKSLLTERKACSCDFSKSQCLCKTNRGHPLVVPLVPPIFPQCACNFEENVCDCLELNGSGKFISFLNIADNDKIEDFKKVNNFQDSDLEKFLASKPKNCACDFGNNYCKCLTVENRIVDVPIISYDDAK